MGKCTVAFIILFCFSTIVYGQERKAEREKKIRKNDVPAQILELLKNYLAEAKKVRYYLETDGEHISYEVKLLYRDRHCSIEFSNSGQLEDVEIIVAFSSLEKFLQENIIGYLKIYDKYKIKKVQKQLSSGSESQEAVIALALKGMDTEMVRYEIIAETKLKGSWKTYELLFDDSGDFISKREIRGRLEDNILY